MSRTAVGTAALPSRKDLKCPRDHRVMRESALGDATVDLCGACQGTFFDSGELFAAAGIVADPSSWDHPETGGVVKKGDALRCPRCEQNDMQAQDVTFDDKHVEIDRCGKCGGIWLDKGELDTIVQIGHAMRPILEAAREKARQELAKMGDAVEFRPPLAWKWKIALAIAAVTIFVAGAFIYDASKRDARRNLDNKEGCPCGCDHSAAMAAALRRKEQRVAASEIETSLRAIAERESAGYITERMIVHRLRLLDLSEELDVAPPSLLTIKRAPQHHDQQGGNEQRCVADKALRVCGELVVHGERYERVKGARKLITPCFRWWLSIENLTNDDRDLALPSIDGARDVHFPISRWYDEDGRGDPWNGHLRAHEKARLNVIGYIPEHISPGTKVDATMALASITMKLRTDALGVIHVVRESE